MNLFRYRPLFLCSAVFMGAASVGYLCTGWVKILLLGLLSLCALTLVAVHALRVRDRYRFALTLVAIAVAAVALVESYVTIDLRSDAADTYVGHEYAMEVTVTAEGGSGARLSTYTVQVERMDGEPVDHAAYMTCYQPMDLHLGDRIAVTAKVISPEQVAGGKRAAYALMADGISFGIEVYGEDYTLLASEVGGLSLRLARLRRDLAVRLDLLCGEDAAGLPAALLLGERGGIPLTVERDFSRAGVAHMLAISGMHMSLLFGILAVILRALGLSPRLRAIVLGSLALAYLVFLDFPPSASRSIIMLGMTYLAHLCSARADTLTSLGVAGALILLISPASVADVGFWMSFSSAFGLVTLMSLWRTSPAAPIGQSGRGACLRRFLGSVRRLGRWGLTALISGAVAMTTSLWITVGVLGEISLLSPVSTLLLTPLMAFVLLVTLLLLPLMTTPLGGWIAQAIATACRLMVHIAERMADVSWGVVSLRAGGVFAVIVIMTAVLLLLMAFHLPRREMVLLPVLVGWIVIAVIEGIAAECGQDRLAVSYIRPSSRSEMLVVTQGQKAVICDLSDGSYNALSDAAAQAETAGATAIETVMLTHYHARVVGSLERLLMRETVHTLWLPMPSGEDDYYIMLACADMAKERGVEVTVYDLGTPLTVFGKATLRVDRASIDRSSQPTFLLSLDADGEEGDGGEILTLCGSSVFESSLGDAARRAAMQADTVIFGNHGPVTKEPVADLSKSRASRIILSDAGAAAWLPRNYLPDAVSSLHVGEVQLTLFQEGAGNGT